MRHWIAAVPLLVLAACGMNGADRYEDRDSAAADAAANSTTQSLADSMASHDGDLEADAALEIPDNEERPTMQAQVVLDRKGFGPGVIDGKMGMSTANALRGFQQANDLEVTGELDAATERALAQWDTIPATRVVRIPREWASLEFVEIPDDPAEQAEMERLGYESLDEKLAERFHTTIEVLQMLNPKGYPAGVNLEGKGLLRRPSSDSDAIFYPGQLIRVPNIGADRIAPGAVEDPDWRRTLRMLGVGTEQPQVEKIVVSKSSDTLEAYDEAGELVALFTVTSGSTHDPLPLGEWTVNGVAHNPPFSYDPSLFWDVPDSDAEHKLPPGPNGPVGVVWIDLSKEHYGIHGTPEPQAIGRAQSHGCVRLTNWDAARLAQMVEPGVTVLFEA